MAQLETWILQDLKKPLQVQYLSGTMFSQDNAANLVGVEVFDDGEPATLGGSVSANVVRSDGSTVAVSGGTLSGNNVSVILPQAAYAIPGAISIIIKLTTGGTVTTLGAIVVNVYRSSTDAVIDPGTIIPSVQNLISQIETAVASIPADYSSLWTSLAPAFSTSTAYTAGQYMTYSGHVYRFTADHAAGSFVNTDCIQVDVGGELSSLKSAFNSVTGKQIIELSDHEVIYIQNNQDNSLIPSTSNVYRCALVPCNSGDTFTINATGRTAGRPWAFVDSNGRIVDNKAAEYSSSDVVVEDLVVTAPSGVSYLVINDRYSGGTSFFGENIAKDITDLTDNVLYKTVTPFEFGAKGDGLTDDTNALQACIDYAVSNQCNVQIPNAVYLTTGITITGYCNIFGNGATIKYVGSNSTTGYVVRVNATSIGIRGVVRDLIIDCNQVAKSGLKVDQNVNVLDFEHIQILNLYTNGYGIYLSAEVSPTSAQGRYKNFDIRCVVRDNSARGLYLMSHDAYFYDIKCVNCRYGAWSEVLACFINFHPFNTYAELMTNSVGLYSTGLTFMTNSYIDTFAKCFGGNGFISIDSLEVFWSAGYYTDESVGDTTTMPVIFDYGVRVFNLRGMRVYPPRGRTVQKSQFTSDPSSFFLYNNPRQGNILEGVTNVPKRQYTSESMTVKTGITARYTQLNRYDEMIVLYTELEVSGLTTTAYKDIATVPSNSRPKTDKSWVCVARNSEIGSNRTCVEVTLNAGTGKIAARSIFGNLDSAYNIVISQEYKIVSD